MRVARRLLLLLALLFAFGAAAYPAGATAMALAMADGESAHGVADCADAEQATTTCDWLCKAMCAAPVLALAAAQLDAIPASAEILGPQRQDPMPPGRARPPEPYPP